jgi:hypothetical protein
MLNDIGIGNIFFTAYDEKITGTSQRDPLGLQLIWSYYGRKLVKHITTISDDIRGFREVVLCLSICSNYYQMQNGRNKLELKSLILLFEQLFVYSTVRKGKPEGIIGADNANARYKERQEDTPVSYEDTILVREISLGYYGRYKTPLLTMGIIDNTSKITEEIDVIKLVGSALYNSVLEGFRMFCERMSDSQKELSIKDFQAFDSLYEAVCGKMRDGEASFWLGALQISGDNKNELMRECYDAVDCDNVGMLAMELLPAEVEVVVIRWLEPFLRCLESVFYSALSVNKISGVVFDDETLKKHKERSREFCKCSDPKEEDSTILAKRIKYLKEKCNPESVRYVKNILDYHKQVCAQKKSSVWLEYDDSNDSVQAFVQADSSVNLETWGRDYYLASLWGIKSSIERLGNEGTQGE